MKKLCTLIILSLLIIASYAQDSTGFSLNFHYGLNISGFINRDPFFVKTNPFDSHYNFLYISPKYEGESYKGLTFGVDAEYHLDARQSFLVGFYFQTKGNNLKYDTSWTSDYGSDQHYSYLKKLTNDYLVIPVVYRRYLLKSARIFLEAGLYSGIWLRSYIYVEECRSWMDAGDDRPMCNCWHDIPDAAPGHTTSFDYGLLIGGGFKQKISGSIDIIARCRYSYGLAKIDALNANTWINIPDSPLVRELKNYYGISSDARNTNLSITLGVSYKFHGK